VKRIIELSSLLVMMLGLTTADIVKYKVLKNDMAELKEIAANNYYLATADVNKITVTTYDRFLINQINNQKIDKAQKEYEEYQEYLKTLIVYDGMTMDQLAEKLDRSLKNELHGYGRLYAEYSLSHGVDPYIAVAISLHETGCNGRCSTLMVECNNVGGQKGSPTCGNYGYRGFDTLEDGIKGFIDNLSDNYFGIGLNTPELMARKYAASPTWAEKVNGYISVIKSR